MISKEAVEQLIADWLVGKDYFLTDLVITPDDRIIVEIDHAEGVWIDDCVALSRHIEEGLDRDETDFELEVGSAGLGQPFKVLRQYEIHLGDDVEVLTAVDNSQITLTQTVKVKAPGEKRPHLQDVETVLPFDNVKWTKLYIDFK